MSILLNDNQSFLSHSKYDNIELLQSCIEDVNEELEIKPEIIVFDKVCHQQRDIGFYSNNSIGYHYSNKLMKSKPLTENLEKLIKEVNEIFSSEFNGILINRYNDGTNYIGAHSDDEKGLDENIGVVSLTYGEKRIFRIRDKFTKKIILDVEPETGDFIQMGGRFQKYYTYEIPVQKKIKSARYSFTFRKHIV